jgi:hypothetical protein
MHSDAARSTYKIETLTEVEINKRQQPKPSIESSILVSKNAVV